MNEAIPIAEKEFTEKMGKELGEIFFCLYNEIIWVNSRWKMYQTLFTKSDKRIDLMNDTADMFFKTLWKILFEDIVLQLAKLTDVVSTKGRRGSKDNMTIRRLPGLVDDEIKAEVGKIVNQIAKKAENAKTWRDKLLAHYDYDLLREPGNHPMPKISISDVDEAMTTLEKLMNTIYAHYCKAESLMFFFEAEDAVDRLVYFLQKGWKAEQEWEERMESGNILPGDLNFTDDI